MAELRMNKAIQSNNMVCGLLRTEYYADIRKKES